MENLRGIKSGRLDELSRLVVLVGKNGAGKSTVLDALLMGASARPAHAIGRAVHRRWEQTPVAEWLFFRRATRAAISVEHDSAPPRHTTLEWKEPSVARTVAALFNSSLVDRASEVVGAISAVVGSSSSPRGSDLLSRPYVHFFPDNQFSAEENPENVDALAARSVEVRLVDMRGVAFGAEQMPAVLTDAVTRGRADFAIELLRSIVPGLKDVRILLEHGKPVVHLVNGAGSVPLSMAGDGIRGVARLAFELASAAHGVGLIEEPEVHQHPRALVQSAHAICEAVARGIQIVVTTHSLDFIDALLRQTERDELLQFLSVIQLELTEGVLDYTTFRGDEVRKARRDIEMELR